MIFEYNSLINKYISFNRLHGEESKIKPKYCFGVIQLTGVNSKIDKNNSCDWESEDQYCCLSQHTDWINKALNKDGGNFNDILITMMTTMIQLMMTTTVLLLSMKTIQIEIMLETMARKEIVIGSIAILGDVVIKKEKIVLRHQNRVMCVLSSPQQLSRQSNLVLYG